MITIRRKRKGVSPILSVLLMIAVAVALSVVIFTWSQGLLSSTSSAIETEQGAQNIAAQSQITIENVIGDASANNVTAIIRNVGSVSVAIGSIQLMGMPSNAGFNESVSVIVPTNTSESVDLVNGSTVEIDGIWVNNKNVSRGNPIDNNFTLAKGESIAVTIELAKYNGRTSDVLTSGDFLTVKVTTTKGSFAQYSATVP